MNAIHFGRLMKFLDPNTYSKDKIKPFVFLSYLRVLLSLYYYSFSGKIKL